MTSKNTAVVELNVAYTEELRDAITSIFGQLSDGMFENSYRATPWWVFYNDCLKLDNGNIGIVFYTDKYVIHYNHCLINPYELPGEDTLNKKIIGKKLDNYLYQIIREEGKNNEASYGYRSDESIELDYLSRSDEHPVTIGVAKQLHKAFKELTK